ncbi:bifunctional 2-C-methyl-D-erythritol 4-phosphate cytidylyltransferase/2-C-methyl-D-erythritol 2,4-cyclodiphosphate synthase [Erythrobacter arachoides]|uniref:Bifunctional enzyme IspD/IspF n=1 Tax=Aurantiacibacter arachoides TaxID=1850444 RepID=A0A845A175_9SPHN|nr:bifunctional 2-C-methyl-D-erythritol 4-phosphate cytidylyltransferase/2-C-methyl-D-erythritol 2,4-cyclodiphosphate synthase [Aurantiacibacter arachoides]MXO93222.1 bifunctional 2-C-methyl-D-erythritol 4-phosphate cytidylyltransferase/2-C-methyl-D-erythritol 2,4-cyclodiphosphate synthase [Aurantiacibacter arachoides]GGD51026.1 bifunctional enzyme IspD/IspF [Aurantiacibacter arachoides]
MVDAPLPPFTAIIVAAGQGLRAGQPFPKQFASWRGKPLVRHAAEALPGADRIIVAIPAGAEDIASQALAGLPRITLITGGETRQESVLRALEAIEGQAPERVLIHDAARPDLPAEVIVRLLAGLDRNAGAIPVLPVVDSMITAAGDMMLGDAQRETLRRVQTPQAFRFADILAAHRSWNGPADAGDDAQVLRAANRDVVLVEGHERLKKLTFAEDFVANTLSPPAVRTGTGFDVHRLVAGEDLWLCGVKIDHDKGLAGHSDADVGLHAVVDAILGACARGDIGQHFPPSDPRWKGAPSARFVEHAVALAAEAGWQVGNVDLTLICEAPKIGPHREAMQVRLAQLLGVALDCVSVKATTTERLGFTGRGEGIAAQAVATLTRIP